MLLTFLSFSDILYPWFAVWQKSIKKPQKLYGKRGGADEQTSYCAEKAALSHA